MTPREWRITLAIVLLAVLTVFAAMFMVVRPDGATDVFGNTYTGE